MTRAVPLSGIVTAIVIAGLLAGAPVWAASQAVPDGVGLLPGETARRMGIAPALDPDARAPHGETAEPVTATGGLQLWASRYVGPGNNWDIVHDAAVDPTGSRVFTTGESVGAGTWQKYATVAYDAVTGAELWVARSSGGTIYSDVANAVTTSPDGSRVFVTGFQQFSGTSLDYVTIAYDAATGRELWKARWASPLRGAWDEPRDIAVSPDGSRVFVTGSSEQGAWFTFDYVTVAYDAATGAEQWAARYAGTGADDHAMALRVTADRVFVAGMSVGDGTGYDVVTVAYDAATGAPAWESRHDAGNDKGRALAMSADGSRLYATGESARAGALPDYVTVAIDAATGATLWASRYDGPAAHYDVAEGVGVEGDRVFISGWSVGTGTSVDYATVAYDAGTGAEVWAARHDGGGDSDYAWALAVGGGRVFVTGQSWFPGYAYDMTTVAYSAETGELAFVARYDAAHSRDYGESLAVDPLGLRVYTAGYSRGQAGDLDYATAAHLVDETALLGAVTTRLG